MSQPEMDLKLLAKGADSTPDPVEATKGSQPHLLYFPATHSPRSCGRPLLVIVLAINTLLTLIAISIACTSLLAPKNSSAEIGELKEKLQAQKELLATILDAMTGTVVPGEEAEVADGARAALGLGPEKNSYPGGDEFQLPTPLLTESEEARTNGGGRVGGPAGRKRTRRQAPIQTCDCSNPNAGRMLNGCCCKKRSNNTEIYNSTILERYRTILKGRAAGHYVACTPSQQDLNKNSPAGEMIAYNLFRSSTRNIFIGDEEPWSLFPSSKDAFIFDPLQATMTIKQDGLYFIYVQVAHVLFTVSSLTVNGIEWLRCQHRPITLDYAHSANSAFGTGRESCNMYGVRPLLAGDKIVILNGVARVVAEVTQPHCSNFGIVKL